MKRYAIVAYDEITFEEQSQLDRIKAWLKTKGYVNANRNELHTIEFIVAITAYGAPNKFIREAAEDGVHTFNLHHHSAMAHLISFLKGVK